MSMFDDATIEEDGAAEQPVDDLLNAPDDSAENAEVEEPAAEEAEEPEAEEPEAEEPVAEEPVAEEPVAEEPVAEEEDSERLQWYVLKVTTNREKSIRLALLRRIAREGLDEFFTEVIIPTENVVETKAGKKRVSEQKLFPGYLFVQMVLNDETWYLVRGTSGIGDFTGAGGKPVAMSDEEVSRMLGKEEEKEAEPARIKIDFSTGDVVKIKDGPFESFEGEIDEIDDASGKISVLIEIFGRHTPAELEYWQVEKV
jgi:transcriptional antiterminator NusG